MDDRQNKTDPEATPEIEIYSISQEKDGSLKISRRDFLAMALTVSSALLVAGCQASQAEIQTQAPIPISTTTSTPTPVVILPQINLYALPETGSNVVEILHVNDIVLLIRDRPDLDPGWVNVTAKSGKDGWVSRGLVDFTRAFPRSTPEAGSTSTPALATGTPTPVPGYISPGFSLRSPASLTSATPAPGTVYVVLTMAGAPPSDLPVTCPQYMAYVPTTTPVATPAIYKPIAGDRTPVVLPNPPSCTCVSYYRPCSLLSCGCISNRPPCMQCSCVGYSPCTCMSHLNCACLSYFPCTRT